MAPHMTSLSGRFAGVASALSLGLLSVATPSVSKAESIAASNRCPEPAVVVESDAVVPVTKANYAAAETQTVFAKYIANVAKGKAYQAEPAVSVIPQRPPDRPHSAIGPRWH